MSAVENVELSEAEFGRIATFAKTHWGLHLDGSKLPLIRSRLRKRLISLGLSSFNEYSNYMELDRGGELDHFVNSITTNVTHFYRELHHFDFLDANLASSILERSRAGDKVRIWSAGCSTGQEPYSLAASLLYKEPRLTHFDLRILATDVDTMVLEKARSGVYPRSEIKFPRSGLKETVFSAEQSDLEVSRVRSELKELVTFLPLNLVGDWPFDYRFDVIMCRNVAIYFDKETQERLWNRFSNQMKLGSHLFIGHSERISNPKGIGLVACGTTTYRRT